jgi:hypothetical protein
MPRKMLALLIGVAAFSVATFAADPKKPDAKVLEGVLVCTKCTLDETDKCGNAVKVKDGDKETVYYIKDKGATEKYHKAICPANTEKDVKVTVGKVSEKDGKKWIESGRVEFVNK